MDSTENAILEISQLSDYSPQRLTQWLNAPDFSEKKFKDLCQKNSIYVLAAERTQGRFFNEENERFKKNAQEREHWVQKILKRCREDKIEIILLKGAFIGATLAPIFSYKKMNDIDLLIKKENGPEFVRIIKELGFISAGTLFLSEDFSDKNHHLPPYYSQDMSCILGVHWQLCSPYSVAKPDIQDIWNNKQSIQCLGETAFAMSWEHNLLHMCFHLPLFKTGPRELQDVAEIIKTKNIDWNLILRLAHTWNVQEHVYRVLTLTNEFLSREKQVKILDSLRPFVPTWIQKETEIRKENLIGTRSVFVAKIEKAYSISVLSKDPGERFKAWLMTWVWVFWPPQKELKSLVIGRSYIVQRLKAPFYLIKAMARDYGAMVFIVITAVNVLRAWSSFVLALFQVRGEKILESKQYQLYKMLE